MSDRLSAEIIGSTPYATLDGDQQNAIFIGSVPPLRIIEVAMDQQPPNESVIAAVHVAAQARAAIRFGAPGFIIDRMTGGAGDLTDLIVDAHTALRRIAAARADTAG